MFVPNCVYSGYHVRQGLAASSDPEDVVWSDACLDCGADLRGTEKGYAIEPIRRLLKKGALRMAWQQKTQSEGQR